MDDISIWIIFHNNINYLLGSWCKISNMNTSVASILTCWMSAQGWGSIELEIKNSVNNYEIYTDWAIKSCSSEQRRNAITMPRGVRRGASPSFRFLIVVRIMNLKTSHITFLPHQTSASSSIECFTNTIYVESHSIPSSGFTSRVNNGQYKLIERRSWGEESDEKVCSIINTLSGFAQHWVSYIWRNIWMFKLRWERQLNSSESIK